MTRTSLRDVTCSIARTVDVLGDAWAWLIVRDVFLGVQRFDELCTDLGISRKVLTQRLGDLVGAGVLERARPVDGSMRFEYRLTAKGADLVPILATLVAWGDRWEPTPGGPPLRLRHAGCQGDGVDIACAHCGAPVTAETLRVQGGPGGSSGPGTAVIGQMLAATTSRHRPDRARGSDATTSPLRRDG